MIKHRGIIIASSLPQIKKITVLDEHSGKIVCMPDATRLCRGMLVHYYLAKKRHGLPLMYASDVLEEPTLLAHHDILFLHHVFELSDLFCPVL